MRNPECRYSRECHLILSKSRYSGLEVLPGLDGIGILEEMGGDPPGRCNKTGDGFRSTNIQDGAGLPVSNVLSRLINCRGDGFWNMPQRCSR